MIIVCPSSGKAFQCDTKKTADNLAVKLAENFSLSLAAAERHHKKVAQRAAERKRKAAEAAKAKQGG